MAQLIILSWNIKDLNEAQVNDPEFIALVVKVIQQEGAQLVSLLETKSDKGKDLCAKLTAKLGNSWRSAYSGKSAPYSNKPENYVFLWDSAVVAAGAASKFKFPDAQLPPIGFPNRHGNTAKKRPSRFPYIGEFKVSNTTFTCVTFHTTFTAVDIAEANQQLAQINEVKNEPNVIIMGDFNDNPAKPRTYRGKTSFEDLLNVCKFRACITDKTSLCQAYLPSWTTTAHCRASVYDNFFVKTAGDFSLLSAQVIDLVDALMHGKYLSQHGRRLFNSWAKRENSIKSKKKNGWTMIPEFQAGETIATIEDAHEVHWVAVSDHLPIRLEMTVK